MPDDGSHSARPGGRLAHGRDDLAELGVGRLGLVAAVVPPDPGRQEVPRSCACTAWRRPRATATTSAGDDPGVRPPTGPRRGRPGCRDGRGAGGPSTGSARRPDGAGARRDGVGGPAARRPARGSAEASTARARPRAPAWRRPATGPSRCPGRPGSAGWPARPRRRRPGTAPPGSRRAAAGRSTAGPRGCSTKAPPKTTAMARSPLLAFRRAGRGRRAPRPRPGRRPSAGPVGQQVRRCLGPEGLLLRPAHVGRVARGGGPAGPIQMAVTSEGHAGDGQRRRQVPHRPALQPDHDGADGDEHGHDQVAHHRGGQQRRRHRQALPLVERPGQGAQEEQGEGQGDGEGELAGQGAGQVPAPDRVARVEEERAGWPRRTAAARASGRRCPGRRSRPPPAACTGPSTVTSLKATL